MKNEKTEKKDKKANGEEIKLEEPRYMMATKAIHRLGDISRAKPDICIVTREDGKNYIGNWVMGPGYVGVRFPKETTRELTEEEKKHYHGMTIQVGGYGFYTIKTLMPPNLADQYLDKEFTITTRNSVYRFSQADKKGGRIISKVGGQLEFSRGRIEYLAIGESLDVRCLDGKFPFWHTSTVKEIK